MPKGSHRNPNSLTYSHRQRASPYDVNSSNNHRRSCKNELENSTSSEEKLEEDSEWKEARCPICMDHPHNAVQLICSSLEKGCKPFICDTSYRHSNCFDQFCKLHGLTPSKPTSDHQPNGFSTLENRRVRELLCPICRGNVSGWTVVQGARACMNSKIRSCALESCDFSGNYAELRKHARLQHPSARPVSVEYDDGDDKNGADDDGVVIIVMSHWERNRRARVLRIICVFF